MYGVMTAGISDICFVTFYSSHRIKLYLYHIILKTFSMYCQSTYRIFFDLRITIAATQ